jgi:hypothetical protein
MACGGNVSFYAVKGICKFNFDIAVRCLQPLRTVRPIYIGRAYCYHTDVAFYIFFSTNISTEYLKHAAHSPCFSSKCLLFHNVNFLVPVLFTFYI